MASLWRFFDLKLSLLIINNRARAPPDELESKISIRLGGFFMKNVLYQYDYLPMIKRYIVLYKNLDEKVAYEIKSPKEFYNYVMCLIEDPSLPYLPKIEYFIKCKGLKGKNVIPVSKENYIDFFKMQKYQAKHEAYIRRKYYTKFLDNEFTTLSEAAMEENMLSLDPLEILIKNEYDSELREKCQSKLSTTEMVRIYKYLYENKNFTEIAREENRSRTAISLSVSNALKKLKKMI